jgi:hypothetical protein
VDLALKSLTVPVRGRRAVRSRAAMPGPSRAFLCKIVRNQWFAMRYIM